jgi:hypothetical protein
VSILRFVLIAAVAAVSLAAPAAAQRAGTSGAPLAAQASVGVRKSLYTPVPTGQPAPRRQDTKQNRAMMIVGGAALLTGAVVGGSAGGLISVGGAVVFLWGLYQFLQ